MHRLLVLLLLFPILTRAQASFTTIGTPYTQNFNSLPNTTDGGAPTGGWTDNVTLPGWYSSVSPLVESSLAAMNNAGANYIIASGTDRNFGSRASGGTGTCYYGVRLVNSTGTIITSVYVQYFGEQWSIAENGSNVNTIAVDYRTGTGLTSLTAGAWTNVAALGFTQVFTSSQSSGMGGTACGGSSNQCLSLNGNAAANRRSISACVPVTLNPGDEIMFRWVDLNDAANDHHMQIDDAVFYPYDVSCAVVLPVELTFFAAERSGNSSLLTWQTSSETNNDYFLIERLNENGVYNAIGTVDGHGTTSLASDYTFVDEYPYEGTNYYRLRQVDFNGDYEFSPVRTVTFGTPETFVALAWYANGLQFSQSGNAGLTKITVLSEDGRIVSEEFSSDAGGPLQTPTASGMYFVRFENAEGTEMVKLIILL